MIKAAGIVLHEDYENELEKLLDYMQLVREFDREKLFVFVNLRSYYAKEEVSAFAHEILLRKFQVLFLDNVENPRFPQENRLIIDQDLCEIG